MAIEVDSTTSKWSWYSVDSPPRASQRYPNEGIDPSKIGKNYVTWQLGADARSGVGAAGPDDSTVATTQIEIAFTFDFPLPLPFAFSFTFLQPVPVVLNRSIPVPIPSVTATGIRILMGNERNKLLMGLRDPSGFFGIGPTFGRFLGCFGDCPRFWWINKIK